MDISKKYSAKKHRVSFIVYRLIFKASIEDFREYYILRNMYKNNLFLKSKHHNIKKNNFVPFPSSRK